MRFVFLLTGLGIAAPVFPVAQLTPKQREEREKRARTYVEEGRALEHEEALLLARRKYLEAEAIIGTKQAGSRIKKVDEKLRKKVKALLGEVKASYEAGHFEQVMPRSPKSAPRSSNYPSPPGGSLKFFSTQPNAQRTREGSTRRKRCCESIWRRRPMPPIVPRFRSTSSSSPS